MKFIRFFIKFLSGIFQTKRGLETPERMAYSILHLQEIPKSIELGKIYQVNTENDPWICIFYCPCGCKEKIILNLQTQARPAWKIQTKKDSVPTISPSVYRQIGCKSHFFIQEGRVVWV